MSAVPPLSKSIGWTRGIAESRTQMLDLQRQLATGKKATTYGGLGPGRSISLAMRARMSSIESYLRTIETVKLRLDVMDQVLGRLSEIGREMRADAISPADELTEGDRTSLQVRARNALDEALSLLRTDVGGRFLFSGRAVDTKPIPALAVVMDGEGGKAGFRQILDERRQADLGADGLGRLAVESPAAGEVTVSEDAPDSPFGFKIVAMTTDVDGATVTGPAGSPPQAGISFAAATPAPGQSVRLALALPDGTSTDVVLTAAAPGEGGPGRFEIGADAAQTAASFQAALTASLEGSAATELAAASGFAAGEDFFNFDDENPPQRVDGPPFDTATAFRDATAEDTVFWYRGDAAISDARQTSVGRIDEAMSVGYGARANEEALRWVVQNLAVMAAESFSSEVASDSERYGEMISRAGHNLSDGSGKAQPESIHAQIASQQHALGKAEERHTALRATAEELLAGVENADPNQVAVEILQLQTRLQASYEVTAMLSQLSLVYHM